jgi:surface antigen
MKTAFLFLTAFLTTLCSNEIEPQKCTEGKYGGQCVIYVRQAFGNDYSKMPALCNVGNKDCGAYHAWEYWDLGFGKGDQPQPNSIMVLAPTKRNKYGHVAVVISAIPFDETSWLLTVNESNGRYKEKMQCAVTYTYHPEEKVVYRKRGKYQDRPRPFLGFVYSAPLITHHQITSKPTDQELAEAEIWFTDILELQTMLFDIYGYNDPVPRVVVWEFLESISKKILYDSKSFDIRSISSQTKPQKTALRKETLTMLVRMLEQVFPTKTPYAKPTCFEDLPKDYSKPQILKAVFLGLLKTNATHFDPNGKTTWQQLLIWAHRFSMFMKEFQLPGFKNKSNEPELNSEFIDSTIKLALDKQKKGLHLESLDLFKSLVTVNGFQSIKARYFLAKQFVLMSRLQDFAPHKDNFAFLAQTHLTGCFHSPDYIRNQSPDNKEYFDIAQEYLGKIGQ